MDPLHSRRFALEMFELLSILVVGYEMFSHPIHAAGEPAPPAVARAARFYLQVLPGMYALSSVRQEMSVRFLAGEKTGPCTVRSPFPAWSPAGVVLGERKVGIWTPCKQRK